MYADLRERVWFGLGLELHKILVTGSNERTLLSFYVDQYYIMSRESSANAFCVGYM